MRLRHILLAAALAVPLANCTTVASGLSSVATSLSSSTPAQVTTLAQAVQAADLITKAVDVYVKTGNPNVATLKELQALSNAVNAALVSLNTAAQNGQSLVYDSFNAALSAFTAYSTASGVSS
jgi:hypothetical protein